MTRRAGFLYFLRGSTVWETRGKRPGERDVPEAVKVWDGSFARDPRFMYWLDKSGNVVRRAREPLLPDEIQRLRFSNRRYAESTRD